MLVDGNGILHVRGFGFASHLGVVANIPAIGVGKTVFSVDGINKVSNYKDKLLTLLENGQRTSRPSK
jgi:deoxyinosine 3'endonuclease (endonuclease V)